MSLFVKAGKAVKRFLRTYILPAPKQYVSYCRRVDRIQTDRRICAMTFDDGPMDLPAAPDQFHGKSLTDVILDALGEFHAKGTFDVVGDTRENYPDDAGKAGSPAWGGIRYDHYPDIRQDQYGGANNNDRLITRILEEGHQITNHGYRHILFGKKSLVYGRRKYYQSFSRVVGDLQKLDELMQFYYGYSMRMGRPPHYVDKISRGFTSYDAYDQMGYLYLGASFDGGGWLPARTKNPERALVEEVDAMTVPLRKALEKDENFFQGQIIFQKDGYNMARRTPVAWGLPVQLETLQRYGYEVVTVEQLMEESPFSDLGRDDPLFEKLAATSKQRAIVFADNTLRLDQVMTIGELAMLMSPREETLKRRWKRIRKTGKRVHPYAGAMEWCIEKGLMPTDAKPDAAVSSLPDGLFDYVRDFTRRSVYGAWRGV